MKIRTIVKASLALGLVTTGASIVTTQSAKAEVASALKSEQLAMISVSPSAITTTTQAVNAEQNHTANLNRRQSLTQKMYQHRLQLKQNRHQNLTYKKQPNKHQA